MEAQKENEEKLGVDGRGQFERQEKIINRY
jgi:hypothetical protein